MYDRPKPFGMVSLRSCRRARPFSMGTMYQICMHRKVVRLRVTNLCLDVLHRGNLQTGDRLSIQTSCAEI